MVGNGSQGQGWTRLGRTADILGIVLGLLAFFGVSVAILTGGDDDAPTTGAPADDTSTTQETGGAGADTSGLPPTTTSTTTPVDTSARRMLLSELTPVNGTNDIDLDFADVVIQGQTYESSLYYSCSLYCDGESPATYEVDLGGNFTTFKAIAGITATGADAPTKIEVDVDGALAAEYVVRAGQPAAVDISVVNAQRLRITLYAPAPLPSPIQAGADAAGGVDHVFPDVALGKPTLLP